MASDQASFWEVEDQANLSAVEEAIAIPSMANQMDQLGNTPLVKAIRLSKPVQRLHYVQALLTVGADPGFRGTDGSGDALFEAALCQDAAVLTSLLTHGANPTYIVDAPESLYDWAEFDYRYEAWDLRSPIASTASDKASESNWLDYLDRCAEYAGVSKPDHLRVLRRFGALRRSEMEERGLIQIAPD